MNPLPVSGPSLESFFTLTPDRVIAAAEAAGVPCTGLCYPLNSLENRVYELERDDRTRVVAKFYRPGRWSREAVADEHRFLSDLEAADIPVAPPWALPGGVTVAEAPETGILYALFPRVGGRAPDELTDDQLRRLGILLGRVHAVGAGGAAAHRRVLDARAWGEESLKVLRAAPTLPGTIGAALEAVTRRLLDRVAPDFEGVEAHRIHGDCHLGNLLWGSAGPFFLDFDDMMVGPAVQDVWLLAPGRDAEGVRQRDVLLEGYTEMRAFDRTTLGLVEPLRALRYLHYAAWITRRWVDPSFPRAFPQYGTASYWAELVSDLEDQLQRVGGVVAQGSGAAWGEDEEGGDADAGAGAAGGAGVGAGVGITVQPVAYGGEDFVRVLMVRDEVFVEEMGHDPEAEMDGRDAEAVHLLARDGAGRTVGAVRVWRDVGGSGWVSHLAVLPEARRRGVGTALVLAAGALAG